jgi:hypothetical protein
MYDATDVLISNNGCYRCAQKGKIETCSEMSVRNRETAVTNGTHCPEQESLLGLRTEIYFHYLCRIEI